MPMDDNRRPIAAKAPERPETLSLDEQHQTNMMNKTAQRERIVRNVVVAGVAVAVLALATWLGNANGPSGRSDSSKSLARSYYLRNRTSDFYARAKSSSASTTRRSTGTTRTPGQHGAAPRQG